MSGDPEQDFFADGITEDIITALCRLKGFLVISRNTMFTYKGKAVDVSRSGANSACATCSKAACARRATASASRRS